MAVVFPVLLAKVDLHVSPDQSHAFHLYEGVAEIRAGASTRMSRVNDPEPRSASGAKLFLAGGTLAPEAGQKLFRYGVPRRLLLPQELEPGAVSCTCSVCHAAHPSGLLLIMALHQKSKSHVTPSGTRGLGWWTQAHSEQLRTRFLVAPFLGMTVLMQGP